MTFFSVTDVASAKHTDLVISSMFCLLGWKLSEDKLIVIDYHTVCKVLGVEFDLKMAGAGLATVSNTEERVRELCDQLENTIQAKSLKRVDGEKLRGRLQFANGQLFGRSSRNRLRILSKHSSGRQTLCEEIVSALSGLREQLLQNSPRRILGPMSDYMHVSVDASFDLDGYSGIGGVVYSSDGTVLDFFSEQVSKSFLLAAMGSDQQTMIQELEMLALLVSIDLWCPTRSGRRVDAFTDSESVRGSFLKSWSFNEPCNKLLNRIFVLGKSTPVRCGWNVFRVSRTQLTLCPEAKWLTFWVCPEPELTRAKFGITRPNHRVRTRRVA